MQQVAESLVAGVVSLDQAPELYDQRCLSHIDLCPYCCSTFVDANIVDITVIVLAMLTD